MYQSKDMLNTQKPGQGDRPDYTKNHHKQNCVKLQIATLNVGAMRDDLLKL